MQTSAEAQEAGLQQGQDARWRAVIRGDEGRRPQGRARDDIELCMMVIDDVGKLQIRMVCLRGIMKRV